MKVIPETTKYLKSKFFFIKYQTLKIRKTNEKQKHTTLSLHNRLVTKYQDPTANTN